MDPWRTHAQTRHQHACTCRMTCNLRERPLLIRPGEATHRDEVGTVGLAGGWEGGRVGKGGGVAVATRLIQQVPGQNGGIVLVLHSRDGVHTVQGVVQVVLVDLHDSRVREEEISVVAGAIGAPLHILQHILKSSTKVLSRQLVCSAPSRDCLLNHMHAQHSHRYPSLHGGACELLP